MIIVGQNKNFIANFSNMCLIYVEEDVGSYKEEIVDVYKIVITDVDSNKVTLAEYKSEDRAKEVLQEIIEAYKKQANLYHFTNVDNVYEMPEK